MRDYSQNGEQSHILHVFDVLGIEKGHLVDLGAGDGYTMSNTRALLDKGWSGDLFDGNPNGADDVRQVWITSDVSRLWCACDLLNIDLDGNDQWVLRSWLLHGLPFAIPGPSLIVAEINPIFQREEAVVMPYNEAHIWQNDTYYGMSLAACEMLAQEFGYTLMHLHAGINAFLLRNDHAEAHPELVQPIEYRVKFDHRPHPHGKPWTRLN